MRNQSNYFVGFTVSGAIHAVVLAAVIGFALADNSEKNLVTVDFSSLSFANVAEAAAGPQGPADNQLQAPEPPEETAAAEEPEPEKAEEPPPVPKEEPPLPEPEKKKVKEVKKPKKVKKVKRPQPAQPAAASSEEAGGSENPGPGTQGTASQNLGGYSKTDFNYILVKIRRKLVYPESARQKRIEGRVKAQFVVKRDGSVSNLEVFQSSGSSLLDEAALLAVRKASPLPKPPTSAKIVIPISFRISDNK